MKTQGREIKFRAWDKRQQKWYHKVFEWVFDKPKGSIGQLPEIPQDVVVMQYTNLKDKNGTEIYEGDIVRKPYVDPTGRVYDEDDGKFEVGFAHGQFVIFRTEPEPLIEWCKKSNGEYIPNYGHKTVYEDNLVLEVIGNIYQNPELL